MKTKLLLILFFLGSVSFAQNWTQVGAAQFTDFANDGAMEFLPTTGEPYIIYNNILDGNKPYVMKFDSVSWVNVGGVISSQASSNHAIKFNPVTNEPWIAYRRISDNKLDVYRYDGTNWVSEGVAEGTGDLSDDRVQIQFNASGNARVGAKITSLPLRIFTYNTGTWAITEETLLNQNQFMADQHYDFTSYNNYFVSASFTDNSGQVGKRAVGSTGFTTIYSHFLPGRQMKEISGVDDSNFLASKNTAVNQIVVLNQSGFLNPSSASLINQSSNTNATVGLGKSILNNQFYLMYSDASNNLVFRNFESNATNAVTTTLPSVGLTTTASGFISKMVMNPIDGYLYLLYTDGPRLSVKKYTIPVPSNLNKIYVDVDATGNNDGSSWANAHTDLQEALFNVGNATTDLWIASGTYKPGNNRSDSFNFDEDNLRVYGGFDGTETLVSERDILNNPTMLSGDLNGDDTGVGFITASRTDNSYHVVSVSGNGIVLDGFEINDGHADGSSSNGYGAGILVSDTVNVLDIKNCQFNRNMGLTGGAIRANFNINAALTIENSVFNNNLSRYGGGLYMLANNNRTVTLDITNTLFTNNQSENAGGSSTGFTGSGAWIRASGSNSNITTAITNCTFANNTDIGTQSGSERGVLGLSKRTDGNSSHNATINNSIFYNNEGASSATTVAVNRGHTAMPNLTIVNNSIDEDSFSNLTFLTNTSNADPLFTDDLNDDFTLQTGSPAIDTGDNSKIPAGIITDLSGNQRIFNTTVDMGAYEFGSMALGTDDFDVAENEIKLYPNPVFNTLNIEIYDLNISDIQVYDMLGKQIIKTTSIQIDVSNLKQGIYLLKVSTISGDIVKRFIKQ